MGEFAITILLSLLLEFMNDQGLQVEEEGRLTGQLGVDAEAWELEGGVKGKPPMMSGGCGSIDVVVDGCQGHLQQADSDLGESASIGFGCAPQNLLLNECKPYFPRRVDGIPEGGRCWRLGW